jgi:FkbM family methyltransferase
MKKILKYFKKYIKLILRINGWKLTKLYKNRTYTHEKPSIELIKQIQRCNGIIHVGAHRATEAAVYDWFQKKIIWIEANPLIFHNLIDNIYLFHNQVAYNYLFHNTDDEEINFYISNNDSASSSVFKFGKESFNDDLKTINTLKLCTKKFDTFVTEKKIDIEQYNFWIIDAQGAELLIMNGAKESLKKCKSIYIEVSTKDYYADGARYNDLKNYLALFNFFPFNEPSKAHQDVLFLKNEN